MAKSISARLVEAGELLDEVRSWSSEDIAELPKLYREKAQEYRRLAKRRE